MYKNITRNTCKMAIPAARLAADDAIIMTYINTQRSASKYTIMACWVKVKFTWQIYALSERLLVCLLVLKMLSFTINLIKYWWTQVTLLSDFFSDETVFVAFGVEKYSAEQLVLSDEGHPLLQQSSYNEKPKQSFDVQSHAGSSSQGSYRPWKVLELKCWDFQASKVLKKASVLENPGKVLEF